MTTEAERVATAFDTGDYTIYEIKAAAAFLRSQAAEIERLKSEAELFAKHTGLTLAAKDTLLRQALEALEKTRAFHQQDWSSEEITPKLTRDTIAAIKQHLGGV